MDLFGKSPRPVWNEAMRTALAIFTASCLSTTDDADEIERIAKVLDRHEKYDGYELAKLFEDDGYTISAETVAELDCVSGEYRDILDGQIERWVKSDGITLELKVGDIVKILKPINRKHSFGSIHNLDRKLAMYGIRVPDMKEQNSYYPVNCEDVEFMEHPLSGEDFLSAETINI